MAKLVKCAACGQQIAQQAPACPHCGQPNKQSEYLSGGQVFMGLLVAFGTIWFLASPGCRGGVRPAAAPAAADHTQPAQFSQPVLELLSHRCEERHGYLFAIGEVKNISSIKLENLMAVGEFRSKAGELISVEDALLEYNPLMPGQKSPFEVGTRPNPMSTGCSIDFKTLRGAKVLWRDATAKSKK